MDVASVRSGVGSLSVSYSLTLVGLLAIFYLLCSGM